MIWTHCLTENITLISLKDLLVPQCKELAIGLGLNLVGICAVVAMAHERLYKLDSVHRWRLVVLRGLTLFDNTFRLLRELIHSG